MSNILEGFKAVLKDFGLEAFHRWYGWYPGEVISVEDPNGQGCVTVKVPMLQLPAGLDELPNMAYPMFGPWIPGKDKGSYNVPDVGDMVWVSFRNGNISNPMYAPWGWFGANEKPAEFETVEDRGWKTSSGHVVRFRDTDGDNAILIRHSGGGQIEFLADDKIVMTTSGGDKLEMDPTGDVVASHRSGTSLTMKETDATMKTSTGTTVSLSATSVSVESSAKVTVTSPEVVLASPSIKMGGAGAVDAVMKTSVFEAWVIAFVTWAAAHTHAAPGSPPVVPPIPPVPSLWKSITSKAL